MSKLKILVAVLQSLLFAFVTFIISTLATAAVLVAVSVIADDAPVKLENDGSWDDIIIRTIICMLWFGCPLIGFVCSLWSNLDELWMNAKASAKNDPKPPDAPVLSKKRKPWSLGHAPKCDVWWLRHPISAISIFLLASAGFITAIAMAIQGPSGPAIDGSWP